MNNSVKIGAPIKRNLPIFIKVLLLLMAVLLFCVGVFVFYDLEITACGRRPVWQWLQNRIANWQLQRAVRSKDWYTVVTLLGTTMDYHSAKPYAADNALTALVGAGPAGQDGVLKYGLKNTDPQIRYMSMLVLGGIGDARCADAIWKVLGSEEDDRVEACGGEALCLLGRTDYARIIVKKIFSQCHWQCKPDGIRGHGIIPNLQYTYVDPGELAFYLNTRFKLGVDVPSHIVDGRGAGIRWALEKRPSPEK